MIEKLQKRGAELAERKVEQRKSEIKSILQSELDDHVTVAETTDGITLQSRRLGQELIDNSSLRDVAFLMRGVR